MIVLRQAYFQIKVRVKIYDISHVFERIHYKQINSFMTIFSHFICGFGKNYSYQYSPPKMMEIWKKHFDRGDQVGLNWYISVYIIGFWAFYSFPNRNKERTTWYIPTEIWAQTSSRFFLLLTVIQYFFKSLFLLVFITSINYANDFYLFILYFSSHTNTKSKFLQEELKESHSGVWSSPQCILTLGCEVRYGDMVHGLTKNLQMLYLHSGPYHVLIKSVHFRWVI